MKTIYHMLICLGSAFCTSLLKGQVVLEALDTPQVFTSTQTVNYTLSYTKNDCTNSDLEGTVVSVTRTATATETSTISQIDADYKASYSATQMAAMLLNQEGQAEANNRGYCVMKYLSTFRYKTLDTYTGQEVEFMEEINTYSQAIGYVIPSIFLFSPDTWNYIKESLRSRYSMNNTNIADDPNSYYRFRGVSCQRCAKEVVYKLGGVTRTGRLADVLDSASPLHIQWCNTWD